MFFHNVSPRKMCRSQYLLLIIISCFTINHVYLVTGEANPYESGYNDSDFFTCGCLRDTKLFIADSLIQEVLYQYISLVFFSTRLLIEIRY